MARSGDLEQGEASRKRLGLSESGVKVERAKKKLRPTENISKLSRKRAWNEVIETVNPNDYQDSRTSKRKVSRAHSMKKNGGEGDKLVESRKSRDLAPNTQESVSTLWEKGDVRGPDIPQKKWKRTTPKTSNSGGCDPNSGPSGSCLRGAPYSSGDQKDASEENLGTRSAVEEGKQKRGVRKVLQTVHLEESRMVGEKQKIAEESSIGLEDESAGIVSSLEQTALNGRDRKRREADKGEEGSPPRQPEKKLRTDVAGAEASHRSGEHGTGVNLEHTSTWKRLKRDNPGNTSAASAEMGVSISEAWKRLREENDTEMSGSSVNGRSDSDLSMRSAPSIPEWMEERSKKARYESPLPPVGRKWKRQKRERKQSSSSKRLRDGNGCESSGSSGSDMAQSSYLENRKWKRPRYENLMSVQGRSLRRQSRDGEEARESSRKRVQGDASEMASKWPRK